LAAVDAQIAAIDSSLNLAGLVIGELERRLVVAKEEAETQRQADLRAELETLKARRIELSDQIADALAGNAAAVPTLVDDAKQTAKRLYGVAVDCGEHPRNAVEYVTNFVRVDVMESLKTNRRGTHTMPDWMKS
jgi:sugar diacid utilization regulator